MKKLNIVIAAVFFIAINGCNKSEEVQSTFNQPTNQELKHSSKPIPIKGSFNGMLTTLAPCQNGWMGRNFTGVGEVSHMGRTTCDLNYCVSAFYPSPDPGIDGMMYGPGSLTAANGDQLIGYFTGSVTLVWDGPNYIGATYVAEGLFYDGTGRFAGASGFIVATGYLDYAAGGGIGGTNIPATLDFSGTIQFGAEILQVDMTSTASYLGTCGTGINHYLQEGTGTGSLGALDAEMDYCATTTVMTLAPPYPPIMIPIGGTNEGDGWMEDTEGNVLNSEYSMLYRFTYQPFLPATTNLHNDFIGRGEITGGTGDYVNAQGKFISWGTQDIPFVAGNAVFPAPGTAHILGYFTY